MESIELWEMAQFALERVKDFKPEDWQWAEFGASILGGIGGLVFYTYRTYLAGRNALEKKLSPLREGDDRFWQRPPKASEKKSHQTAMKASIPIVTIFNLKGGVAKSASAANLAAYFDQIGARVLLIDFDYQGTLTDAVVRAAEFEFSAQRLIENKTAPEEITQYAVGLPGPFERTDIFPAYYMLAGAEKRASVNWLIGYEKDDIRFFTHNYLKRPEIQEQYDIVIIDAPPRLDTAAANALTASSHVLLPTILDGHSASAAIRSLKIIEDWRVVNPAIEVLGIVPTFVAVQTKFSAAEQATIDFIEQEIETNFRPQPGSEPTQVLKEQRLLRKAVVARLAGERTAYFDDATTRNMYSLLGAEIIERLGERFRIRSLHNESQRVAPGVEETGRDPVAATG